MDATKQYRLTHPDYYSVTPEGEVQYSREGLRFYTEQCKQYGVRLPLPRGKEDYEAMIWRLLDAQADDVAAMLQEDGPRTSTLTRLAEGRPECRVLLFPSPRQDVEVARGEAKSVGEQAAELRGRLSMKE
ncbi:MAG: hypothetical protein Q8M09_13140 [Pseudomonadota bacterium]|nr:hypothetical protein [Pseudomonadota bacterium]MDP1905172.1 hypothetical protein [Pseudomonadota bacterium]